MGKSGGKSKVGKILSIGLAVAGAFAPQIFGLARVAGGAFKAALYGLSLGSTIGSAFSRPNDFSTTTQGAFDAKMNRVDGTAMLPIIYGTQKAGGMQTYHRTNHNGRVLYKHVLVSEGEIHNVRGVAVNSYLCPFSIEKNGRTNNPQVFGLKNNLYEDATVQIVNANNTGKSHGKGALSENSSLDKPILREYTSKNGSRYKANESKEQAIKRYNKDLAQWETNSPAFKEKRKKYIEAVNRYKDMRTGNDKILVLYANGTYDAVLLQHSADMREDKENEMFTSFAGVYQYIVGDGVENTIKEHGWELVNPVNCQDAPEKIQLLTETSAYNRTVYCSLSSDMIAKDSHFNVHLGSDGQAVPDNYMAVGGYPSMAYVDGSIKWTEEVGSGNPTVTMLVDGRTLYDPRIRATRFSKNPALVLMDYMTNPVYGAGQYITRDMLDMDSFIDVANYCDELVYYENQFGHMIEEPRYEIDLTLTEKRSHLDNIKDILKCFAGFIVFSNDKICLRVERKQTPVYHFDKDNIVEKSLAYKGAGIDQSPNKLLMTYIEPALDYNAVRVIVEDSVNQLPPPIGRGRAVEQEIQLAGVARQSQALRLGKIYRDIIRLCPITVTFKTGAMAMHLEPGDIITLTKSFIDENGVEQNIFDRFQCRIIEIREEHGTYEITARQYNPSIYDDKHGATLKPLDVLAYNKPVKLTPTNVERVPYAQADVRFVQSTAGVGRYDLIISWQIPDGNYSKGRLSYKAKDVNTEWVLAGDFETVGTIYNVMYGKSYDIKIETVDSKGIVHQEAVTTMSDILITNNTAQPSDVTNFRLEATDKITASWDSPSDATQVMYYELRTDDKVSNDGDGLITRTVSNKTEISLKDRTGKIYVYVRNLLGTYSRGYIHTYDIPKLEAPRLESQKPILGGVSLQFNVKPKTAKELHIKVGNALYISQTNQYNFMGSAGIYDMTFCWVDYFGECTESESTRITIQANIPQEYLAEQANAISSIETRLRTLNSDVQAIDNKVVQTVNNQITGISSKVTQLNDLINSSVANVNQNISSQITQLTNSIDLKVQNGINSISGDTLISRINLSSNGTRIDGKLLHVTGQAKFDDNIITNKMLQANAVTADKIKASSITADKLKVDSLSSITANVGTLTGGTITGSTIIGTTLKNASGTFSVSPDGVIKGATIDAQSFRKSGFEVTALKVENYTLRNGSPLPIPKGFNFEDCRYIILNVTKWVESINEIDDQIERYNFAYDALTRPKETDILMIGAQHGLKRVWWKKKSIYAEEKSIVKCGVTKNKIVFAFEVKDKIDGVTKGINLVYREGYLDVICIAIKG